jgi:hypothetical protein
MGHRNVDKNYSFALVRPHYHAGQATRMADSSRGTNQCLHAGVPSWLYAETLSWNNDLELASLSFPS